MESAIPFTSLLPSFVFVCPSNCGFPSFTEMTQVSPSFRSSPEKFSSYSFRSLPFRAASLTARVRAVRRPETCVPPSIVWIMFAKAKMRSR